MKKIALFAAILTAALSSCCNKNCETTAAEPVNNQQSEVIRLNVFYTLNPDADAAAMKIIADSLVTASRTDAGCISYDMYESVTTPGQYIIIETWENDSLLDIHSHAPHFEKFVPQLHALGTMSMQRFNLEK